jgi:hypothetical protein
VLDAHPEVAALDEPTAFLDVLQPEFHKSKELSGARLNTLRRLYIQALLRELGSAGAGKLLVDKNPSPTARLPLWLKVFPGEVPRPHLAGAGTLLPEVWI